MSFKIFKAGNGEAITQYICALRDCLSLGANLLFPFGRYSLSHNAPVFTPHLPTMHHFLTRRNAILPYSTSPIRRGIKNLAKNYFIWGKNNAQAYLLISSLILSVKS